MLTYDEVINGIKVWPRNEKFALLEELVHTLREETKEVAVQKTPEELGWPPGYFERAYGIQRHDPIERQPQPEYQEREGL